MRIFFYVGGVFLLLFAFSATSFAGEFANFKFIGFSKDGKYLAFEESGISDGMGEWFSNTYFIDTVKNSFALPPVIIFDDAETPAQERLQAIRDKKLELTTANNLRKLKIVANNTGELLVAHLPTDWSYNSFSVPSGDNTETVKFNNVVYANSRIDEQFYELTLKSILVKDEPCTESYKFDLTLANKTTTETLPLQILQSDKTLPTRRNCPYGYNIERVYFYEDKIAVFLSVFNQGFEGPSRRYLAVTAKLDNKPADKNYMAN